MKPCHSIPARRFGFILFAALALIPLAAAPGSCSVKPAGADKAVECSRTLFDKTAWGLIAPYGGSGKALDGCAAESAEIRSDEIIYTLNCGKNAGKIDVFVSRKNMSKPSFARTRRFDVRYRKDEGVTVSAGEESAIKILAKAVGMNADKNPRVFDDLVEKSAKCASADSSAGAVPATALRSYRLGPLAKTRIFGIPAFALAAVAVLMIMYMGAWALEKRGRKRTG